MASQGQKTPAPEAPGHTLFFPQPSGKAALPISGEHQGVVSAVLGRDLHWLGGGNLLGVPLPIGRQGEGKLGRVVSLLKEIPADLADMPTRQLSDTAREYAMRNSMKIAPITTRSKTSPYARPVKQDLPTPKDFVLNYQEGDKVRAPKYGIGVVKSIHGAGADFEVEVSFGEKGTKKFMAKLSKLIKVSE